jgi:ribosomal protein S18 acetylase RimI-like enzyme
MTNTTIRLATPNDAPLLTQMGARLFEQSFGDANEPANMRAYLATAFTPERQSAELGDPECVVWIAEDAGGAAVGYAMLRRGGGADGVPESEAAEVQRLYVDRTWHGRGVAAALMNACIDHASHAWHRAVLWLGVWQLNPRAIAFYNKMGFESVGTQTFTLGEDVQHDYIMRRILR